MSAENMESQQGVTNQPSGGAKNSRPDTKMMLAGLVVIVILGVGIYLLGHNNSKTPTFAKAKVGAFCIDGKNVQTPVHNFYGQGNEFATAFANIFVKDGGVFYTSADGNIFDSKLHYKPVNHAFVETKHTITAGVCK